MPLSKHSPSQEEHAKAMLLKLPGVSRETLDDLTVYAELLVEWQARINLVAPSTLPVLWMRHIFDSAQLHTLAPEGRSWLDIGSGGGLPGLVLAVILKTRGGGLIHLVESNHKKAAFLQHVITRLALPAILHVQRIERVLPQLDSVDVVTARAFTDLAHLLEICNPLLIRGAVGLFPKGRDVESELTNAIKNWHFIYSLHPSLTDKLAFIVRVQSCKP